MKSGLYTVDRIEEGVYVLENRDTLEVVNLKKENATFCAREGDIVRLTCNRCGRVINAEICIVETQQILEENTKKLDSLFDN